MPTQDEQNLTEELDPKLLWKRVLSELQLFIAPASFNSWLVSLRVGEFRDNTLELISSSPFIKEMVDKRMAPFIQENLTRISRRNIKFVCVVGRIDRVPEGKPEESGPLFQTPKTEALIEHKPTRETQTKSNLSPKFTFENYLMGKNNQLAFAIATAVAKDPGKAYNPFFIYSGVGLGKTHLMQAIGNKILEEKPGLRVIYCTGESFTNELIESIQSGRGRGKYTSNEFRNKFRKADVLLIDDIQFISGREATQEEFFHTFNALHMSQKQIVLTSDRPPKDFTNIEQRITSRFGSGMIADIQPPDRDMRSAILRSKRDANHDQISNEVVDFIAEKVNSNVRELEGAYLQVLTYIRATAVESTIENAAKALGQTLKEDKARPVNLNQIVKAVCNYYSVKMIDLKGDRRNKEIVLPRQVAMYLMYQMTKTPYMSIGEFLGGRDHTTIMHGVEKITGFAANTEKAQQDLTNIKELIFADQ